MTGMRDFARAVYLPGTEVSTDSPVEDSFLHLYRVWRPQCLLQCPSDQPASHASEPKLLSLTLRRFDFNSSQLSIYRDGQLMKSESMATPALNAGTINEARPDTLRHTDSCSPCAQPFSLIPKLPEAQNSKP